jgi:hypothetical protein
VVSEDPEGLVLGRDQAQLNLWTVVRGAVGCGHQREVVKRQRPACPGRLDECHSLDTALVQLVEQHPVVGSVASAAVGEHSLGVPLAVRAGTQGEHEHVVPERLTISGDHSVLRVQHVVERAAMPASAELRRCVL